MQETDGMCEYAIYVLGGSGWPSHSVCVLVCLPAGLIKRQEGDVLESLELFQRTVTLSPNNSSAVKQVAQSLYVCLSLLLPAVTD